MALRARSAALALCLLYAAPAFAHSAFSLAPHAPRLSVSPSGMDLRIPLSPQVELALSSHGTRDPLSGVERPDHRSVMEFGIVGGGDGTQGFSANLMFGFGRGDPRQPSTSYDDLYVRAVILRRF